MDRKGLAIMILAAVILLLLFAPKRSSGFAANEGMMGANLHKGMTRDAAYRVAQRDYSEWSGPSSSVDAVGSSSLIPRDVVATEDFGQFSPDKILGNQNYLDPRSQIGYPETVGGVLRNANQQFRSEPMNPRTPVSIFNVSTIPPDTMRPAFEISPEYQ
jgi:hypothetical protein